jgi:rhomboid family GlyGly-CTERM serine protease
MTLPFRLIQEARVSAEDSTKPPKHLVNKDFLPKVNLTRHERWRGWSVVLLIALCSVALEFGGDAARLWARYERIGLEDGEWWRLATAHLVHLGWGHLWPNLLALLLIGSLFEQLFTPLEWLATAAGAALAIDTGLYTLDPGVDWYVGLSGVLHGLVAAGAVKMLGRQRGLGAALAIGLAAKLLWEQTWGPIPFTQASVGGPVVVAAHLYGAAAGVVAALVSETFRRRRTRL